MEIVLGIDNIVFISILTGNCRRAAGRRARRWAWRARMLHAHLLLVSLTG